MKTDDKTRESLNAELEREQARTLGKQVGGLEQRVERHSERIARVESEPPPARPRPPRPTPPTLPKATPATAFRASFASDPDLRRQVEEERQRQEWLADAQKKWAAGREQIDREQNEKLDGILDDGKDTRAAVAIIARELGIEDRLPASCRRSLPPQAHPKKPALGAIRARSGATILVAALGAVTAIANLILKLLEMR